MSLATYYQRKAAGRCGGCGKRPPMADTLTLPLDPQEPDALLLVAAMLLHADVCDALVLWGEREEES